MLLFISDRLISNPLLRVLDVYNYQLMMLHLNLVMKEMLVHNSMIAISLSILLLFNFEPMASWLLIIHHLFDCS